MSFSSLLPYIFASIMMILIPGQDMLFVLTQSISSGNRAGIMTVLGSVAGIFIHTLLAAAGLSIILQKSILAFSVIKIAGIVYLLYLSIQAFREPNELLVIDTNAAGGNHFFRKGFITNLSNPKVAIFFLTFLPQFVNPHLGHANLQMMLFGGIYIVETLLIFTVISIMASKVREKIAASSRFQRGLKHVKGTVFGILGINLLFSDQ